MKQHQLLLLIFAFFCMGKPGYASVQPKSPSLGTQITHEAVFQKKAFQDFARSKKAEQKVQKRAERYWKNQPVQVSDSSSTIEQIFAAVLCLFLGGLGIHRIYLKSDPIIILWYFISLGGFFGIIPLIDFIRILMGQTDHYRGNSNLFRAFQ